MIIACVAMALASGAVQGPSVQQDEAPTVQIRIDQDGGLQAASCRRLSIRCSRYGARPVSR
jgi:hypothetical protein